ncbi:MAG: hypothetical protein SNJ33_03460 [Rikenellaceae bacterium]
MKLAVDIIKKILLTYITLLVTLTLAVIAVHFIPRQAICDNIISSTQLIEKEGFEHRFFGANFLKLDNFTDTYMLNVMAGADCSQPVNAAMMSYRFRNEELEDFAPSTARLAQGDDSGVVRSSYARYWHGYQVVLRPLLTIMDLSAIRVLNFVVFSILIATSLYLIKVKISTAVALIFALSLLVMNFWIVPLSMQFSTCFHIMFVAIIAILSSDRLTQNRANRIATFFAIGAICSYFDFLTTPQITLGVPLIIYILAKNPQSRWIETISLSTAWFMGYALFWVSKWGMLSLLTPNSIFDDALGAVSERTSTSYQHLDLSVGNLLQVGWASVESRCGLVVVACVVVALAILLYAKVLKSKQAFVQHSYLLLISLFVPMWFFMLRNHSVMHRWFTWRALLVSLLSILLFIYYTTDLKKIFRR